MGNAVNEHHPSSAHVGGADRSGHRLLRSLAQTADKAGRQGSTVFSSAIPRFYHTRSILQLNRFTVFPNADTSDASTRGASLPH